MRPLRLQMKGFGAFHDETAVDFTDVELAALWGPTGSGKSTIIDGITFALFGVIARYDDRRAVAPAINQMLPEARVLLDFEVDGEQYTAVRVARRTDSGATTKEARLQRGTDILAGRASEMDEAVEQILGLNFDRFTKTVVLPQGRFAAFLHDKPGDRQELLRQLLDLGIYERMGAAARQRANTALDKLEVLEPRLQAEVPSEEEISALAETVGAVTEAQEALDGLLAELAQSTQTLADARREADGLGVLLLAVLGVRVPDQVLVLGDQLRQARDEAVSATEALNQASQQAREAEQAEKDGPNIEKCQLLIQQLEQLAGLTEQLRGLDDDYRSADQRHHELTERATEIRTQLTAMRTALEEAREAAEEAESAAAEGPDMLQIHRFRDQREELAQLSDQLEDAKEDLVVEQTGNAEIRESYEQARGVLRAAVERLDGARAVKQAEGLVAQLVEGEPCPVCRQQVHSLPEHDLDAELKALQRTHKAAEDAKREHEDALDEANTGLANALAAVESAAGRHDDLVTLLADAPEQDELDRLVAFADDLATAVAESKENLAVATKAESDLNNATETKAILTAETDTQQELAGLIAERKTRRSQHDELADQLANEVDEATLAKDIALAEQLAVTCRDARSVESQAKKDEQAALKALEGLVEAEREARSEFAGFRDGFASLSAPAPQASLAEDWQVFAAWASQLADDLVPELDKAIGQVGEAETRSEECAEAARAVCVPHFDPGGDPKRWPITMATAVQQATSDHERACEQRQQMADLESQIGDLRTEEKVAKELGLLLRTNGFERWLLAEAVGDLLIRASDRLLQLSNGQYSFDPSGTDFNICDHHNADQVRHAKTLSGGETFLASLALALALSDSHAEMAPEGAPGLDSLFLDEGFGTLDPETLDVTAAAIEELGASGRMVAIVTHIRELAERMPIRFEVTKTPKTSSVTRVTA